MYYKKTNAFTLSEVLITLAIIGIIAALSLPILFDKSANEERKTGVKAAYSILGSVMKSIQKDNGNSITGLCDDGDSACFLDMAKQYLHYLNDCDTEPISNGCWKTKNYYDGSSATISGSAIVLNNGMMMLFNWDKEDCDATGNDKCGSVAVDINGMKGPNKWGFDTFSFHILDNAIKPYGLNNDTGNKGSCSKSDSGEYSGMGCTAKYVEGYDDND